MNNQSLLEDEQRKWFLEMESHPGKDAMKIVEMTAKDLEYYINIVDKAVARFERTDSSFERNSTVGKILQIALHATVIFHERKSQLIQQTSLSSFKKRPQPPQPSANTTLICRQPSTARQDPPPAKR